MTKTYGPTMIIDPPWAYTRSSRHEKLTGYSTDHKYPPLTEAELATLPIGVIAEYVFVWTTGPFLVSGEALRLIAAWGLVPVTMFPWIKCNTINAEGPAFKPEYGVGYWFRGAAEYVILAKRPKAPSIRTAWVGLLSPNAEHSRKPDTLHQLIETNFPGPYIEVFGRRKMKGWRVYGNEAPGDGKDIRITLAKLAAESFDFG